MNRAWKESSCRVAFPLVYLFAWLASRWNNTEARVRPHLLILRYGYYGKESAQPSTEKFHLDETLLDSGLASFTVKTYEAFWPQPIADFQFLRICIKERPEALVVSSWSDSGNQPSSMALNLARQQFGIRVLFFWWDTCSTGFIQHYARYFRCGDAHIILDNPCLHHLDEMTVGNRKVIPMWTPQTPRLFQNSATKDIDLAFLGQVSSYRSYRVEVVEHLKSILTNVKLYFSTSDRASQPTHAEYAAILSRAKMSVNFSYSVEGHQLKGRVFDVMLSGGLLFESENEQISKLFCPMKDYVPFSSKEDLVAKIKYFLLHEDQLNWIARNGRAKVIKKYGPAAFWKKVLGEAGCI